MLGIRPWEWHLLSYQEALGLMSYLDAQEKDSRG